MTRIQNLFPSSEEKEKVQSQSVAENQQSLDHTPFTMRHLAIIMDGNGRWANKRHLPRLAGHKAGVNALRRVLEYAVDEHIEMLSVYAFSTENWGRPRIEVEGLMRLFWETIRSDIEKLHREGVRLRHGDLSGRAAIGAGAVGTGSGRRTRTGIRVILSGLRADTSTVRRVGSAEPGVPSERRGW